MKKPEMILFDYGDTLLCEPEMDGVRGMQALFPYMTANPENCTAQQLAKESFALFEEYAPVRKMGFELHEWTLNRLLFESHGITFSVSEACVEQIFWENACPGAVMPYAPELLNFLHAQEIRTGVVSNIGWSACALTHRLNRLLPQNHFEFVMTSSEYMVRKPDQRLFRAACCKAQLPPEKIWFCGDNIRCDVEASLKAGMQPVWYNGDAVENVLGWRSMDAKADVEPLQIHDWRALIKILTELDVEGKYDIFRKRGHHRP